MDTRADWWKRAVIYQVYPRSFADSDGDGIGDIPGILGKLDYLQELGIDAIWLSPVYTSPQYDNGYDVADYRGIDPLFGTMEDMDRLIAEAGKRGIRILMDLVLNHSSDRHPWFLSARESRESPYHDYYIWKDGAGAEEGDDASSFGEDSWVWVPEVRQYYYYQFSPRQPDLNWNNPALRAELYDMIRWWIDKGVGGFRLDVVDHLGKDPAIGARIDGPELHARVREMSAAVFQKPGLVTVGEAWSATTEGAKLYTAPDGSELSMVFQFKPFLLDRAPGGEKWDTAPLSLVRLKKTFAQWQRELHGKGWNSLFWENHDLPRIVSRWGEEGAYREASAKMLAILLFGMEGTPFIYQGQELGMTNIHLTAGEYQDVETRNMIDARRARGIPEEAILRSAYAMGRDNARTPMQWSAEENAGFTAGTPWLPVNPNYPRVNAAEQTGRADSVLECYRRLIRLRREHPVFTEGDFQLLLPEDEDIFAYTRTGEAERLLILCNFHGEPLPCPLAAEREGMTLLISNYEDPLETLRPYEARMYLAPRKERRD